MPTKIFSNNLAIVARRPRPVAYTNPHTRVYQDGNGNITVRTGGTLAWRNNNPGNVASATGFVYQHGAIGTDKTRGMFPTKDDGIQAHIALLKTNTYQAGTLKQAIYTYAPPSENDTPAYLKFVEQKTGIDGSTPMKSLSPDQIKSIAAAMELHEGYKPGIETTFPVGTPQNTAWAKTQTIDPKWALAQPPGSLTKSDIDAIQRTPGYQDNSALQGLVASYHDNGGNGDAADQDATGRNIPTQPPVPGEKPTPPGSSGNGDPGDGGDAHSILLPVLVPPANQGQGSTKSSGGGSVPVRAYERGGKSGKAVNVQAYSRSAPASHSTP